MRMKEFLIFLVIFTACYIIFWLVYEKLSNISLKKKAKKHALSMINIEQFTKFASFYGVKTTTNTELVMKVFDDLSKSNNCTISDKAKAYGITNIEFVIIVLYLEYLGLIIKKNISLDTDIIKIPSFQDQNMMQKYNTSLQGKKTYTEIIDMMGDSASNDLFVMNNNFLMPGVRLIDSKLYYVGDYL